MDDTSTFNYVTKNDHLVNRQCHSITIIKWFVMSWMGQVNFWKFRWSSWFVHVNQIHQFCRLNEALRRSTDNAKIIYTYTFAKYSCTIHQISLMSPETSISWIDKCHSITIIKWFVMSWMGKFNFWKFRESSSFVHVNQIHQFCWLNDAMRSWSCSPQIMYTYTFAKNSCTIHQRSTMSPWTSISRIDNVTL